MFFFTKIIYGAELLLNNAPLFVCDVVCSPLEQFEVFVVVFFIFTNSSIFLMLPLGFVTLMYHMVYKQTTFLWRATNAWAHFFEILLEQLIILIVQNLGVKLGQQYFAWLVVFFISICSWNLIGMVPYAFTTTSHIIITLAMSTLFFGGINIWTLLHDFFKFGRLFVPNNVPLVILPFLSIVEVISYIARLLSLAIRLFANMMAGHTLLKILIAFTFSLVQNALQDLNWMLLVLSILPFLIVFMITFLEVAIAMLQAYVFLVLLCLYIRDLHVAH